MKHRTGLDRSQTLLFHEWLEDYIGPENPVRFLDAFAAKLAERENPQITQISQISFPHLRHPRNLRIKLPVRLRLTMARQVVTTRRVASMRQGVRSS